MCSTVREREKRAEVKEGQFFLVGASHNHRNQELAGLHGLLISGLAIVNLEWGSRIALSIVILSQLVHPPSTGIVAPVTNDAPGPNKNTTTAATSSGVPNLRIGTDATSSSFVILESSADFWKPGVSIRPGATTLTRM